LRKVSGAGVSWSGERRWVIGSVVTGVGIWCLIWGYTRFSARMRPDGTAGPAGPAFAMLGRLLVTLIAAIMTLRGLWWRLRGWCKQQHAAGSIAAGSRRQWDEASTLYRVMTAGQPLPRSTPARSFCIPASRFV